MTEPTPLQIILAAFGIFSTVVSGVVGAWAYRVRKAADTRQTDAESRAAAAEGAARRAEARMNATIESMRADHSRQQEEDNRQKRQLDLLSDLIQNQQEREEQQALERDRQHAMNLRQQAQTEHLTTVIDKFADNNGALAASIEKLSSTLTTAIAGEVKQGNEDMANKVDEIKGELAVMGEKVIAAMPRKPAELATIQATLEHVKQQLEALAAELQKPAPTMPDMIAPSTVPPGTTQTDLSAVTPPDESPKEQIA